MKYISHTYTYIFMDIKTSVFDVPLNLLNLLNTLACARHDVLDTLYHFCT